VGDSTRWLFLAIDVIVLGLVIFIALRAFNTRRTLAYLGLIGVAVAILITTAYLRLPGLHLFSQLALIVLVIGYPIYFRERWQNLFGRAGAPGSPQLGENSPLSQVWLGVISLVSSLMITFVAEGINARTSELPGQVKLSAANVPEGMSANFGSVSGVSAIIRAPRDAWSSIKPESFTASVDVGNQAEGTYDLKVAVNTTLQNVEVVRVKPTRVVVTIEPVIKKTLPVVVKFSGQAGDELVPDKPIVDPEKVEVTGAKSVVSDLTQAVVQLNLGGETNTIETKLSVVALSPSLLPISGISFEPSEVFLRVPLVKAGQHKTVGIKPVITGQPASGYWVKTVIIDPSVVRVTGPVDNLEATTEIPTAAISVDGLSQTAKLTTALDFPSGIIPTQALAKYTATVEIAKTTATKSITPEIIYDGLSPSLKVVSINPAQVSVIISGESLILEPISGPEVKLKLNLSLFQSPGNYSVDLKNSDFVLPQGVGLVSFLPSAISVTLESK